MSKITSYFSSNSKPPVKKQKKAEPESHHNPELTTDTTTIISCSSTSQSGTVSNNQEWPTCWTVSQKNSFCCKNDWLVFEKGKLGCSVCKKIGGLGVEKGMGMTISKEWVNCEISLYGDNREQQLTSLRKKIFDHKESSVHKVAVKTCEEARKEKLETVCLKSLNREKEITCKVFRTAYKVAKKNQSFNNFQDEINLQELNGVDMGRILHSTNACINIVNHIGEEMRKKLVKQIIESKSKISIIIDESTTVSQKSMLIVYFRVLLPGINLEEPLNLFIDLIELENVTASGIFSSLMSHLEALGLDEGFLKENLVSLTCDGAAVMFGSRSGVSTLIKERFPYIVLWHCASHRLELSVHDAVKEVGGINRFKSFLDKLYVVYHASPKNARGLQVCASILEMQILRIGRILSTRWVASSYNTVAAVWQNYEALVLHFEEAKVDKTRDKKDRAMYEGLLKKITSVEFILDLGLMCDALQELSELSLDLQERNTDLYKAHNKIVQLVEVFEARKEVPGSSYKMALLAAENLKFNGVTLHKKGRADDPPICLPDFYESLKNSVQKRLLSCDDVEMSRCARVLDPQKWPEDAKNYILYGEEEIHHLSTRFRLDEREMVRAFREYLKSPDEMPEKLLQLQQIIHTIPVSSSECERGFSQMNIIVTPDRSSLLLNSIKNLMFIRIVAPPLPTFDPSKYVNTWLLRGHHSATDTKSKARKREVEAGEIAKLWKLF